MTVFIRNTVERFYNGHLDSQSSFHLVKSHERTFLNLRHMLSTLGSSAFLISGELSQRFAELEKLLTDRVMFKQKYFFWRTFYSWQSNKIGLWSLCYWNATDHVLLRRVVEYFEQTFSCLSCVFSKQQITFVNLASLSNLIQICLRQLFSDRTFSWRPPVGIILCVVSQGPSLFY